MQYTAENLLRLTKRWNNPKRAYLLVNPLQGKHIPAKPSESWDMMRCLGRQLAGRWPDTRLVVGFAETATAVAAAVADCFGEDCIYIHTTREDLPEVEDWITFQEEHSHAVEQKLCGVGLENWLRSTPQVLIVDDELSTGKTIRNIAASLRARYPALTGKPIAAASLLNRLDHDNMAKFQEADIQSDYLVKLPEASYTAMVSRYEIVQATDLRDRGGPQADLEYLETGCSLPDPRTGVQIGVYVRACEALAENVLSAVRLPEAGRVLVLGTEECMYPALTLGRMLERRGVDVCWYATTRSPIGICSQPGYPVTAGCKVHSLYSDKRETYLYNLRQYDLVLLVSDADPAGAEAGLRDVAEAVRLYGCSRMLYIQGGRHV